MSSRVIRLRYVRTICVRPFRLAPIITSVLLLRVLTCLLPIGWVVRELGTPRHQRLNIRSLSFFLNSRYDGHSPESFDAIKIERWSVPPRSATSRTRVRRVALNLVRRNAFAILAYDITVSLSAKDIVLDTARFHVAEMKAAVRSSGRSARISISLSIACVRSARCFPPYISANNLPRCLAIFANMFIVAGVFRDLQPCHPPV